MWINYGKTRPGLLTLRCVSLLFSAKRIIPGCINVKGMCADFQLRFIFVFKSRHRLLMILRYPHDWLPFNYKIWSILHILATHNRTPTTPERKRPTITKTEKKIKNRTTFANPFIHIRVYLFTVDPVRQVIDVCVSIVSCQNSINQPRKPNYSNPITNV